MEISRPIPLCRLPKPLQETGGPKFGPSWGVRAGVKRKRHEICVGVDCDSVNVYDIRSGRNVFSRSIPPTATVEASPTSVRWKNNNGSSRTVCFVLRNEQQEVFSISAPKDDAATQTENRMVLQHSDSAVICTDVLGNDLPSQIFIVQGDGTATLATLDLSKHSTGYLRTQSSGQSSNLKSAVCFSSHEARNSILKSRSDLYAETQEGSVIIATVAAQLDADGFGTFQRISYRVWMASPSTSLDSEPLRVKLLVEHDLTEVLRKEDHNLRLTSASFEPKKALLTIGTDLGQTIFTLNGAAPQVLTEVRKPGDGHHDTLLLSTSNILTASPEALRIVDTNFGTIQGVFDLPKLINRKRKLGDSAAKPPAFHLLQYFGDVNRVVAYSSYHLLALDISSSEGRPGFITKPPSLAQNLGRGTFSPWIVKSVQACGHTMDEFDADVARKGDWSQQSAELDKLFDEQKNGDFIMLLLQQLDPRLTNPAPYAGIQPLTPRAAVSIPDYVVDFALLKLFTLKPPKTHSDKYSQLAALRRWHPLRRRLVENLSAAGALCVPMMIRAQQSQDHIHGQVLLHPNAIATALLEDDPSGRNLLAYVENDSNFDLTERTATVKLLLDHLSLEQKLAQQPLITKLEGQQGSEKEESNNLLVNEEDGDPSSTTLRRCLTIALDKLASAHLVSLSSAFRSIFTRSDVFAVIQFLRQQLFQGGYTGFTTTLSEEVQIDESKVSVPPHMSLPSVIALLLACLDVIGRFGNFGENENEDFSTTIIPDLLSEISLATNAVEQCADLQGFLRETVRYSTTMPSGHAARRQEILNKTNQNVRPGDVLTLYTEDNDGNEIMSVDGCLPLSLGAQSSSNSAKVRKGGGQKSQRSQREIAALRDRERGLYSFERLLL